ncbi:TonB-dependent receptor [Lichenicola cladoniae]|uniref:TonB-dependent receptor n=1 Tax=Lichenicola cladoniae TaxID=1484109 RepID=A0A6M8HMR6_9PROT|nr:TonB-dependent receptor [Lichenicola cladoniae]NPD67183.1 TonB-dependent receptor [Acetobacteraceae bacterium]QKE89703.1 TonB-dependent receptor [Lichenicola cladoniae]
MHCRLFSSSILACLCVAGGAVQQALAQPDVPPLSRDFKTQAPTPGINDPVETVTVRLDRARSGLQPSLGAEVYRFGRGALATIPQGDNTPLNQVLLQAPGVAQDSYGQIHVRGDHNEVQFRLDGVQLPEGLAVFGQSLQTRFAHDLSLTTGALPAQYGFLQAAVINIDTKSGITDPGGEISVYGGARDYFQPSAAYGGSSGRWDWFVTADVLHNRIGIENSTGAFNAIHDLSNQYHGIGKLSFTADANTRVSLIAGVSNAQYQIPNNPAQVPGLGLSVNGTTDYASRDLTEHQREITDFAILSLQKQIGALDLQSSVFTRYSSLYYTPDPVGDLLYDGIALTAARSVMSTGTQTDASWRINNQHTLRAGFQLFVERNVSSTNSVVSPQVGEDGSGNPMFGDQPISLQSGQGKTGMVYGLYVQDEWRILPRVTINTGLRFDGVSEYIADHAFGPRVNVVWRPTDTTTLHVGYARYFTPPPFEQLTSNNLGAFAGTSAAPAQTLNDKVQAERDNYYDAGIDQIVLPGLHVGVDAYYKQASNLIDEGQFGAPIILSAFNYARGEVHGYEATASYDKGPLSLYGSVAWSRAIGKDLTSSQFNFSEADVSYIKNRWVHLDHDQRWTGSAGAAYSFLHGSNHPLRASVDLVVGSGLRADGDVPNGRALPGYYVINTSFVQTFKRLVLRGTEIRLDILNLLDRRYLIRDGSGIGVGAPQYGLRRTILGGITQRF